MIYERVTLSRNNYQVRKHIKGYYHSMEVAMFTSDGIVGIERLVLKSPMNYRRGINLEI